MTFESLDFLLNPCGDLAIENGDLKRVTGADLIRQLWLTRVRTFKGEFVRDLNRGVPYVQEIFSKLASTARIEEIFRDITLNTPGVLLVESVQFVNIDPVARSIEIIVEAQIDGPEGALGATFHYDGTLGLGDCFFPSAANFPTTIDDFRIWFDAQDLANLTYNSPLTLLNKAGTGQATGDVTLVGVSELGNKRSVLFDSTNSEKLAFIDTQAIRHGQRALSAIIVMKNKQKVSYSGYEDQGLLALNGFDSSTLLNEFYDISYRLDGDTATTGTVVVKSGRVGAELLTDGDMESPTVDDWTANSWADVTKSTIAPHGGTQSLRVESDNLLADGDMEANGYGAELFTNGGFESGITGWQLGNSPVYSFPTTDPYEGTQYIRVEYGTVANPYVYQAPLLTVSQDYRFTGAHRADGNTTSRFISGSFVKDTMATSWQAVDEVFTATNNAFSCQTIAGPAVPGYSEFDGLTIRQITNPDWSIGNSALITKRTVDPNSGTQYMRVSYNGTTDPFAFQTILTATKTYRVTGYFRGDGTAFPQIGLSGGVTFNGTSSTTWQQFDQTLVAGGTQLRLTAKTAVDGYAEFDDVNVTEVNQTLQDKPRGDWNSTLTNSNIMVDGDCEASGTGSWLAYTGTLSKQTTNPYDGLQLIRITYGVGSAAYAYQTVLTPGNRYRVRAWYRSDGGIGVTPAVSSADFPTINLLFSGSISTSWQEADFIFTAASGHTHLMFGAFGLISGRYIEWDEIVVQELDAFDNPVGNEYSFRGWARSEGIQKPRVYNGNTVVWEGTASTSWQQFETQFLPTSPNLALSIDGDSGRSGWDDCELNDITTTEVYSTTPVENFDSHIIQFDIDLLGTPTLYVDGIDVGKSISTLTKRSLNGDGFIGTELDASQLDALRNYFEGNIGEILVYEHVLTEDERAELLAFLQEKWGI